MKLSLLLLCFCAALATPALAQNSSPAPKFDWKLRLTKGQTWTQTLILHTHSVEYGFVMPGAKNQKTELDMRQTLTSKNEVIKVSSEYYLLRVTYTQSNIDNSVDGKRQPATSSSSTQPDLVGISFLLKQSPNGRVLDVTGLEEFVARKKKTMDDFVKNSAGFGIITLSVASLKRNLIRTATLPIAPQPLAVGGSYAYPATQPIADSPGFVINGKRTLLSFDAQTAVFNESGMFFIPPKQVSGPREIQVKLTGDAAKLYMAQKYKATPASQPTYLSKNGRIYYREAKNPTKVIWLDPPAAGIQLSDREAARYHSVRGYNGQTKGIALDKFYPGNFSGSNKPLATLPATNISFPKNFVTMNGLVSGKSIVDAATGLILKSDITQTLTGKYSFVDANGHKQTQPIFSTTQITSSTSPPEAG